MRVSLINLNLNAQDAIGQCLLNQVRFFRRRGHDVRVYVMGPPHKVPDDVAAITQVVTLADLAARHDPHFARSDLYVYHYPSRYPLIETIKGIDRGAVIFYHHNVTPPHLWGSDFESETLRYSAESVGPLARYADLIVTPSEFNARQLEHDHGCDPGRIRVLPLAVDLERFQPGLPESGLLWQYNLEGRRVILFVGRMAGNKRVDLLVEALPLVHREVPNAVLLLVGDDRGNPAIEEHVARARARAAELGVASDVIFTGPVDDLAPYYRSADLYATASLHEGFGVPLIEAMASGLPVVASRATAHPWVLGDAGRLAEPGDPADLAAKITEVLANDDLYGELVQHGLARAREFSVQQYQARWGRIVAEVTAWLPNQPLPRRQSLTAAVAASLSKEEARQFTPPPSELLRAHLAQLDATADVMIRGYVVRSRLPLLGRLIAWVRRNLTSHLREPYVDPMFERQAAFNRHLALTLRELAGQVSAATEAVQAIRQTLGVEEPWEDGAAEPARSDLSAPEWARALPSSGANGAPDARGHKRQAWEERLGRIETLLAMVSTQVALLGASRQSSAGSPEIGELQRQLEALQRKLGANDT